MKKIKKINEYYKTDEMYYQVRTKGDGDLDYFIIDPDGADGYSYDPNDLINIKEFVSYWKEENPDKDLDIWVVQITEEILDF